MAKHRTLKACLAVGCSALVLTSVLGPAPAEARNRNAAGIVGGIMGAAVVGAIISDAMKNQPRAMPSQPRQGSVKKRAPQKADDEEEEKKSAETKAEEARVARANHLAKVEEERAMDRTRRLERQRNIDTAVHDFLSCLQILHTQLRSGNGQISGCTADAGRELEGRRSRGAAADVRASRGGDVNQVTAGEIRRAVEDAYAKKELARFERLANEMWTRDRLMVGIIDHAARQLGPYFKGIGVKGASMDNLRDVFLDSAATVYTRAFEISEIVGVSYSFDRFIHAIYENADLAGENLATVGNDGVYERLVSDAINTKRRALFISDDNAQVGNKDGITQQFHYRFRARRQVYDCLASSYPSLLKSGRSPVINISSPAQGEQPALRTAQTPGSTLIGSLPGGEPAGMWTRVKLFVQKDCSADLEKTAQTARAGRLELRGSRFDFAADMAAARTHSTSPVSTGSTTPRE